MTVYLVGAGPGDSELVTVRGERLLRSAVAVVYDRLVADRLIGLAAGAELHDVGKRPGGKVRQEQINELLVDLGSRFASGVVVRLKGGDPYTFGRGGEEALALEAAGIAYEVVPGVSAVNGVLAYAGIPLTHRGLAASYTVVTGHGADGSASGGPVPVDWDAVARVGGTVVVLMGVEHRAEIAARLVQGGRKPSTPVAVIERGTLSSQRTIRTTLDGLADTEPETPATIVIGEVASLDLAFFERRPLFGWAVAVTRTRLQASELSIALADAGAVAIEVPTIGLAPPSDGGTALDAALARLDAYAWVVFTSPNAVDPVFERVRDARAFGAARVAAIGPGTARALRARGIEADLVPERFVAEALADAFPPAGSAGARALLPRAAVARDVVPAALEAKGYAVDVVEAYRTIRPEVSAALAEDVGRADAVTFTSSSTVTGWLELLGAGAVPPVVACIGPITAATARAAGIEVSVEAPVHSIPGLVNALASFAAAGGGPTRPGGSPGAPGQAR